MSEDRPLLAENGTGTFFVGQGDYRPDFRRVGFLLLILQVWGDLVLDAVEVV